jgi:hypothetical protein
MAQNADFSISRMRTDTAVKEPKCTQRLNEAYMLAPIAFRGQVCGTKYCEANDPETEIWRACQRSGTTGLLVIRCPPGCILLAGLAKL